MIAILAAALTLAATTAQPTSDSPLAPPPNGVRRVEVGAGLHSLVNATVHVSPSRTISQATVVIRDGRIERVIEGPALPAELKESHDCTGLHLYAGFIEPYLEVEVPRPDLNAPGTHWNPRVTPQRSALDSGGKSGRTGIEEKTAQTLRELGFTAAAISPRGGIFRGRSAVVSLGQQPRDPSARPPRVYRDGAYQAMSFETTRRPDDEAEGPPDDARWSNYPGSQMGAIALIRQTLSDAGWAQAARAAGREADAEDVLAALFAPQRSEAPAPGHGNRSPVHAGWTGLFLFDVGDPLEGLRAAKLGKEFSRPAALLGSGREYQRLGALAADGLPLVLPLGFPKPPRVGTVGEQYAAELEEMMHWEQAPTNPRRVDEAYAAAGRAEAVSLTTDKLPEKEGGRGSFDSRLAKAIKHGLKPERALAMLTTNPAKLLGVEGELGTIEAGKAANFVVADGPLFTDRPDAPKKDEPGYARSGRIVALWIDGREHILKAQPEIAIGGHYEVAFTPAMPGSAKVTFDIDDAVGGTPERPELRITKATKGEDGKDQTADIEVKDLTVRGGRGVGGGRFECSFEHEPFGEKGVFVNSGVVEKDKDGRVVLRADAVRAGGQRFGWVATRTGPATPKKRSLVGAWPLMVDGGGGKAVVLVLDAGNVAAVHPAPGTVTTPDAKSASVDRFTYDGTDLAYSLDTGKLGGTGVVNVTAKVDWSSRPPRLAGEGVSTDGGSRWRFGAVRRDRNLYAGTWRITQADGKALDPNSPDGLTLTIAGKPDKPTLTLAVTRAGKPPIEIAATDLEPRMGKLFFKHPLAKLGMEGESRDELVIEFGAAGPEGDVLIGLGRLPDGSVHPYQAARTGSSESGEKKETAAIATIPAKLSLPFGPYGLEVAPAAEQLVITNATIWTCKDGTTDTVIENGAVVISEGKIQYVGPAAATPRLTGDFTTIDAGGRFITPGIIDCHSHTGISRGVNEAGQAVTAEVRIADVTDPDDVSWYRQLAGGVTCVNNLHGSANAIGGQSMVNKVRWGARHPDDMHFERHSGATTRGEAARGDGSSSATDPARGSLPGIKFALGENPKQSNWGDRTTTRYPQTRMGVETIIRDRFTAAREYAQAVASADPPRRDLELEALAEVLAGTRLVHCHSYRQDEILMLCRVARDFGFKVGTFQHILEGYKVADELAKWSGGGSAFSDWWAYKVEVQDAIPAAGPIMAEQGVVVSFNSDSDEMARRMNVEAGKAARYSRHNTGGQNAGPIPVHEAFKFVTINAAKQLHIDALTGSLEAGKDADLAIWSGLPTSPMSRCEATFVDGRRLFSLEQDKTHRASIASERARLIQKVLASGEKGGDRADDKPEVAASDADGREIDFTIDLNNARAAGRRLMLLEATFAADDYRRECAVWMLQRGLDPRWMSAADCGCGVFEGEFRE